MNRKVAGIFVSMGIAIATFAGTAHAQNSPGSAALDASLRGAVERKDVPGVIALVTDRQRVLYQGVFGVANVSTGRPLATDAHVPHRLDDQADHVIRFDAARRAGPHRARRPGGEISAGAREAAGDRIVRRGDRSVQAPPGIAAGDRQALPDPHVRPRLSIHQRNLARLQAERPARNIPFGGPLLFDPGERWHYSTSTEVVGRLVEVISGQKLEDYFRQHIFAPLKMDDTFYNVPEAKGPRMVAAAAARRRQDGRRHRAAEPAARPHHPDAGRRRRPCLDRERLRAFRAHVPQWRRSLMARAW